MEQMNHISKLGYKATDKVTGLKGVITSVSFDLYGCVTAILTPEATKDGTLPAGQWFDITRLDIKSKKPVVSPPDFNEGYIAQGKKGAALKPVP